jgi:hypothetical protein
MTSKRCVFTFTTALVLAVGCGNYSNEDLEFMNALPDKTDLSANLPAALTTTNEAELATDTHDTVKTFNGILDTVLGGVELIRSYQPTGRGPDSRTWGPIPADKQPGWQWQFVMTRLPDESFTYEFDLEPVGAGDAWLPFITGNFVPAPGVRRGVGSFTIDTTALRNAAFPFDVPTGRIDTLTVSYQTKDFPISVTMHLVSFPNFPLETTTINTFDTNFGAQADGSGALQFSMTGNFIPVTSAIETVEVMSQWLPTGAGRATLTVTQGDGAGMMQTECWDASFTATFESKPWGTAAENIGDPSLCPAIPVL